jgi:hypothetical protein
LSRTFAAVAAAGAAVLLSLTVVSSSGATPTKVPIDGFSIPSRSSVAGGSSAPVADFAVTTNDDIVNGDVSSPAALLADPGPDGISLREAVLAADNGGGGQTITFAPSLAGETISPQRAYINLSEPGIAIQGLLTDQGQPAITIDDGGSPDPFVFQIAASDVSISGLRFTDITCHCAGISVAAGEVSTPQLVENVTIENNVFYDPQSPSTGVNAIYVQMPSTAEGAEINHIAVIGNSFDSLLNGSDGVLSGVTGNDGLLRDVEVEGNSFSNTTYPVEFVAGDAANSRIDGARVVGNTFVNSLQPVNINQIGCDGCPGTSSNVIDGTLVEQNVFRSDRGPDVVILGGLTNATNNLISNTTVRDNLMTGSTQYGGVDAVGGRAGSSGNVINGVQVINNTITQNTGGGVQAQQNLDGGSGNTVTNVTVLNSIVTGNSPDFDGVGPSQVSFSLTDASGYAGANGNISGDPEFVDPANGDFHLQAGSPAIDAGTSNGAPPTDLECRSRVGLPDMGAYEFGGAAGTCPPPTTSIDTHPSSFTQAQTAAFSFESNIASSTFECKLDSGEFAACASPQNYSGLADGVHVFQVRAIDPDGNWDPDPATYSWTVDTTPPVVSIDTHPADPTNATTANFSFSASEAASFQCKLDTGTFTACTSPTQYSALGQGGHTFAVEATDQAGNTSTPAAFSWTTDTTPPTASIDTHPATLANSASAAFTFSADEQATFQCKLDGGSYEGCTSPAEYNALGDGTHTVAVQATDQAGNTSAAASYTWTIDTTPPVVSIDTHPADPTNATTANFSFSANETATFQCQLDNGGYTPCASPIQYSSLSPGGHAFSVQATDQAGNTSTSIAYSWAIDTTPPDASIDTHPADPTNATSADFAFSANEQATFQCSLDNDAFTACTSPTHYSALGQGGHTFAVEATDQAGNTSTPATFSWTIDTTAPTASIDTHPPEHTNSTSAAFTFSANEDATFQCKLDAGSNAACTSPLEYSGLSQGTHTLAVKATDQAGNTSAPATFTWLVEPPERCVAPAVKGKRLASAKHAIASAHCGTGKIAHAYSMRVKKGRVISQRPAPGARLKRGAKIDLVVSKGHKRR